MLELKGIVKNYVSGDEVVSALKGIDLRFRKNEFVSILGPSGCGKTTLLNIIGGLDKYTDGDLVINGISTKFYKDRDWDSYRNHKIGFVFQSYNLIPHQTVLSNVELALTLSGVSKAERRKRAKEALERVGLGDQLKKRPNQMSGGQMQRVAIARALVNDPDIILADEPTGALDTETGVQVMDILKEISKDRLIIMVTHNPELAENYSTRMVRMLDGKIISDSRPLTEEEIAANIERNNEIKATRTKKEKMPSMSFATSFMLSLKNLFTKKGRTVLTSFAGSIGIIGIALILAVSQGTTVFIDSKQEEALSSYPLTLEASTIELGSLMETFMNMVEEDGAHDKDAVYKKEALSNIVNAMSTLEETENDLKSFNEHLLEQMSEEESDISGAINGIQYGYDLELQIYTKNVDGDIIRSDSRDFMEEMMMEYMGFNMSSMENMMSGSAMSSMEDMSMMNSIKLWQELLPGIDGSSVNELITDQYDLVYGSWPKEYNEVILILDKNNELDDVTLYALGLLPEEDIEALIDASLEGGSVEKDEMKWSYEEICQREYKTVLNSDCYSLDTNTGIYTDLRDTDAGLRYIYDNGFELKITGVIRPSEESSVAMLQSGIGYTSALTEYVIENNKDADVIEAQLDNQMIDVLTGLPFESSTGLMTDSEKEEEFRAYVNALDEKGKASTYLAINCIPTDVMLEAQLEEAMKGVTREEIELQLSQGLSQQLSMSEEEIQEYLSEMADEELNEIYTAILVEQIKAAYAQQVLELHEGMSNAELAMAMDAALPTYTTEQCARYHDEIMTFSESDYDSNLISMGYIDIEKPASINIYTSSFENKDIVTDAIDSYNDGVEDVHKIKYTDLVGIMMSSMTLIIDAITYVLIAFVAISLVVSSIMIGVITLISVQERTKEIGILRAIGASKKNVSRMFNAETMIVGLSAGLLGIIVTYLLCIPINAILMAVTGLPDLKAILPVEAAVILIAISVLLTLISGLIPSRSAAKKDPVVALRTE